MSQQTETVSLPKFTKAVFSHPDAPNWDFAAITRKGQLWFFREYPVRHDSHGCYDSPSYNRNDEYNAAGMGLFDPTGWPENSVLERHEQDDLVEQDVEKADVLTTGFKAGDLVWCPRICGGELFFVKNNASASYPLKIENATNTRVTLTLSGRSHGADMTPSIFLATTENKERLQALYPEVMFQDPPATRSESARNLLRKADGKHVLCLVSRHSEAEATSSLNIRAVERFDEEHECFMVSHPSRGFEHAVPLKKSDLDLFFVFEDSGDNP